MSRKYSTIWNELKTKGSARVAAPVPFHRRIIRAVSKEKYMDWGYKLVMSETGIVTKISYQIQGNIIRFKLSNIWDL